MEMQLQYGCRHLPYTKDATFAAAADDDDDCDATQLYITLDARLSASALFAQHCSSSCCSNVTAALRSLLLLDSGRLCNAVYTDVTHAAW